MIEPCKVNLDIQHTNDWKAKNKENNDITKINRGFGGEAPDARKFSILVQYI